MMASLSYGKDERPRLEMTSIVTNFRACRGAGDKVAFLLLIPINLLLIPLEIIKYFFLLLCHCCCRRREKLAVIGEASDWSRRSTDASDGTGSGTGKSQKNVNGSAISMADYVRLKNENQKLRSQLEVLQRLMMGSDFDAIDGDEENGVDGPAKSSCVDGSVHGKNADPSVKSLPEDDDGLELQRCLQSIAEVAFFGKVFVRAMEKSEASPDSTGLPIASDASSSKPNEIFLADFEKDLIDSAKREAVDIDDLSKITIHQEQTILSIICRANDQNMIVIDEETADLILGKFPSIFRLLLVCLSSDGASYPHLDDGLNVIERFHKASDDTVALINIKSSPRQARFCREYSLTDISSKEDYINNFNDKTNADFNEILKIAATVDFA